MTPISADTVFRFFSVREFTIYFSLELVDLPRWSASKALEQFLLLLRYAYCTTMLRFRLRNGGRWPSAAHSGSVVYTYVLILGVVLILASGQEMLIHRDRVCSESSRTKICFLILS